MPVEWGGLVGCILFVKVDLLIIDIYREKEKIANKKKKLVQISLKLLVTLFCPLLESRNHGTNSMMKCRSLIFVDILSFMLYFLLFYHGIFMFYHYTLIKNLS